MKCPKCKQETAEATLICNNCGYDLTKEQKVPKESFVKKGLLWFVVFFIVYFLFFFLELTFVERIIILFLAVSIVLVVRRVICKIKEEPKRQYSARDIYAIIFFLVIGSISVIYCIDAPAIDDDYTLADLRNAPANCSPSSNILMTLAEKIQVKDYLKEKEAPLIGLTIEDVNTVAKIREEIKDADRTKVTELLSAHQNEILLIWDKAQKGRGVIKKLDSFEEIADLDQPMSLENYEKEPVCFYNLRNVVQISYMHIYLQTIQGNIDQAIDELVIFNSFFRKLCVTSRSAINKITSIAGNAVCLKAANFIANDSETSQAQLERLESHFPSFSKEQLSLRNILLFEYMIMKQSYTDFEMFKMKWSWAIKPNSTIRLIRNCTIDQINFAGDAKQQEKPELSVLPGILPGSSNLRIGENRKVTFAYKIYNSRGADIIKKYMLAIEKICEVRTKMQIYQDMLQIVLNKRLGRDFSLKARDYGDEYIIDIENKKIFSPGPDRIENTDDDIKLNIDPQVLGWTN